MNAGKYGQAYPSWHITKPTQWSWLSPYSLELVSCQMLHTPFQRKAVTCFHQHCLCHIVSCFTDPASVNFDGNSVKYVTSSYTSETCHFTDLVRWLPSVVFKLIFVCLFVAIAFNEGITLGHFYCWSKMCLATCFSWNHFRSYIVLQGNSFKNQIQSCYLVISMIERNRTFVQYLFWKSHYLNFRISDWAFKAGWGIEAVLTGCVGTHTHKPSKREKDKKTTWISFASIVFPFLSNLVVGKRQRGDKMVIDQMQGFSRGDPGRLPTSRECAVSRHGHKMVQWLCRWCTAPGGKSRPSKYSAFLFLFFHMGPKHGEDSKHGREPGNLSVLPNIIHSVWE